MRNVKQVLGVVTLLGATAAWASSPTLDMKLGPMSLSPIFLGSFVAFLIGLFVRSIEVARLWAVLLGLGTVPAVGWLWLIALLIPGYADEQYDMSGVLAAAIAAMIASYIWAYWHIFAVLKRPQGTPKGSQPT
jgi:uncharacterized membrane protein